MAFAAGVLALRWEAAQGNAVDCARDLGEVLLTAAVVGLFAGRLASMIGSGINPLTSPFDILIVRGGVATGPAALAALATVAAMARGEVTAVADSIAVASLAALGGWQLGCLPREACLGTPTELPWAMTQPGSTIGRHPVELYATAIYFVAAVGLAVLRKRRLPSGLAMAAALLVAAGARLVTEPLRPSLSGGPIWWYVAGVLLGVGGLAYVWRRRESTA